MSEEKRMELWTSIYLESSSYDESDRKELADTALESFDKQFSAKTEDSVEDVRLSVGRLFSLNGSLYIGYKSYNFGKSYAPHNYFVVDVSTGRACPTDDDSNLGRLCEEAYRREK